MSDLSQYHGRDLRDLWRDGGDLTPRYALWLVEHLPEGSAFVASLRGGQEHRPWTTQRHLEAATVNLLFSANRQRAGKPTRTLPVHAPKPKTGPRAGRVVRIASLPGARRVAEPPTP